MQINNLLITPWTAYTPTIVGFGTPTSVTFFSRRVGSNLEVRGTFTAGTSTAVTATATLGFAGANGNVTQADTTVIKSGGEIAGQGYISTAGALVFTVLTSPSDTKMYFGIQYSGSAGFSSNNGNAILGAAQTCSFTASFPIAGW